MANAAGGAAGAASGAAAGSALLPGIGTALGAIAGGLAGLFGGGGDPTQVLKPQAAQGIQLGPPPTPMAAPQSNTPAAPDASQMILPTQVPMQGGTAFFSSRPESADAGLASLFGPPAPPQPAFQPDQNSNLLNAVRSTVPQEDAGDQAAASAANNIDAETQRDGYAALSATTADNAKKRNVAGKQAAPAVPANDSKIAASFKNNFASTDPNQNAAASYIVGGANAGTGAGSEKFLGLSNNAWQGIGVASSILANLFKSDPSQVLQIQQRSQNGPPPVSISSIPTIQSRNQ